MTIVKTHQGNNVDMDALATKNGNKIAAGNINMNARGDLLGPGGTVIKKREEITAEYYASNPNAVPTGQVPLNATLEDAVKKIGTNPTTDPNNPVTFTKEIKEKTNGDISSLNKLDLGPAEITGLPQDTTK